MSRTSNCPECTQPVTIPEGVDPTATVRCPTCEAQYPLSKAAAGATEAAKEEKSAADAMAFLRSLEGSGDEPTPPELVVVPDAPADPPADDPPLDELPLEEVPDDEDDDQPDTVLEDETPGEGQQEAAREETPVIAVDAATGDDPEEETPADEAADDQQVAGAGAKGEKIEEESTEGQGTEPETSEGLTIADETGEEAASDEKPEGEGEEEKTSEEGADEEEQPAETSDEEGEGEKEGGSGSEGEPVPAAPPAVDPDPLVRSPHDDREFRLSELIVASTGEALGTVTASTMVRHDLVRTLTETPAEESEAPGSHLDFLRTGLGDSRVAIDTGAGFAADDHSGFAIKDEELEQQETATGGSIAARPRRKKKEKSLGREMVGIVLGGIAGVILASYAVVMLKGDQANFLGIPLPGCPSTYKHCPDWWPGWLKIGAKSEQTAENGEGDQPTDPGNGAKQPAKAGPPLPDTGTPKENPFDAPQEKPKAKPKSKPKSGGKSGGKDKPKQPGDDTAFSLAGFPSYSSDELGKGLAAANAALGCKECNSTGKITKMVIEKKTVDGEEKEVEVAKEIECPVCGGAPADSIKRSSYDEFCRLAELRTFVDETSGQAQLDDRIRMIRTLLERIGQEEGNREKIASLADERLADESRLEPGILLGGTVEKLGARGSLQAAELVLGESGRKVVVVSRESLPVNTEDKVLVLGSIVEDPGMRFTGFKGSEPLVVFAKECVTLP